MSRSDFTPTHEFHLHSGEVVKVVAELRGDWIAFEQDGTSWYTVLGDLYLEWSCSVRGVTSVEKVVKYGHRFEVVFGGMSWRFKCECGECGTWKRSHSRAYEDGLLHASGACYQ